MKMGKVIDLDSKRPPPMISEEADVICCSYCGAAEYFVDVQMSIWCSHCFCLAFDNTEEVEIIFEWDGDEDARDE